MKKKYSFDSIIGKKSKLRMPRHVFKEKKELVIATLPANNTLSEPPFSTNITMKKGDPFDLCDQINDKSQEYNTDIPLRILVTISNAASVCEVQEPPVYELLNIAFDLEEFGIEQFHAPRDEIVFANANLAIIKNSPLDDYFINEVVSNSKTIFGNITSYNCRRKKIKRNISFKPKTRRKSYLKNAQYLLNKKHLSKFLNHFTYRSCKYKHVKKFPLLFERIDYFYDIFEDWDEAFDNCFQDPKLINLYNLYEYLLLYLDFKISHNPVNFVQDLLSLKNLYTIFQKKNQDSSLSYDSNPFFPMQIIQLEHSIINDGNFFSIS